ncbi:MAG: beta-ketoacyl-[acyl-carrier-protein] synthase II [Candidatus Brocadia sp.]|nr:3-oxoacyl-[acyl-carrier-protein] synthase 2 [Candidatus Brocadia fulgida]MCC6326641.1 beta-ketoacyl-[acyl-carrier-protein] synthase family protein [Candidatus Brocadia sp.]MCE7910225.1 beta-ketoacyl-[acyl-carrier-protein] synthase family protein [Candidatus Brocadia sp. AMX3]MDG5997031.1 beta-ketoacyl-[acyl-carrier-protein] synthase family protein [Candidatus Brocadia sp.]RIK03243.1 MAG: beta-ketoacyl-[acyl-carrier-protein] synthase II [Candidatus Brocadia sp.]
MNRRVVVTGIGMITAHGIGIKANWTKIKSGMSSIQEIASFDSSKYRGKTGGEAREFSTATLNNLKNKRLDRASHLLIHTTREALADANIIDAVKNIPVLLSVGTTLGGMISGEIFHKEVIKRGLNRAKVSRVFDYLAHYQAIHLFKELELKGDFFVFSNACASGTDAIGHAFNSIRHGDYDVAICGGYDTMSEFSFAGFNSLMAITPTLCMPFDKKREGLVLGEGAGVLILEELEHAHKRNARILGEIAGYGASSDACHMTSPEPSGKGAAIAIKRALKDAGHPEIDYINAHGTGTKYNDIMETNAVVIAFEHKAKEIPVSSIKPMIGHLLGGAGTVEAIVSLLSILYKTLIPNINYTTPDPECALNIVRESMGCNIKTILSNSFGFGGSNAAIIIREYVWRN